MKVAHVTQNFSPISETFIYDLITELETKSGLENHVVTIKRQNSEDRPFCRVHCLGYPKKYNPARLFYRAQAMIGFRSVHQTVQPILRRRLKNVLRDINPDILHTHFGPMGELVLTIAKSMDIPVTSSFYGADVTVLPKKGHVRKKYRRLFKGDILFHGISNHVGHRLKELGAPSDQIRVVHLGIRLEDFMARVHSGDREADEEGAAGKQSTHRLRCLHVGRLVEKKGPLHLIRAFHHAREEMGASIHLTIAGDGPLRSDVETEIDRLGLESEVEVLGSVSHSRVPELMARSHIYTQHCVTASNGDQEGMGVTFVEASATGLPIVTTRHNGIPDVVKHERTGYLVKEGDIEAMGRRIAQLASSPEKRHRLGQAGRDHVQTNFQLSNQADKMTACYREAIDLKNKTA